MNPFTTKNDPLVAAASSVLAEASENAMTALDLRKKYGGAYVSSMDFKEYEGEQKYINRIKEFMRKNRLSPKETAVFHEDGFAKYESFPAMLRLLDKKKIVYDDFKDSTSAGVIVFSLKPVVAEETDLDEAKFKFNPAKHEVQVSDKRTGGKFSITVVDKATNSKVLHRMSHELPMSRDGNDGDASDARVRDAKRVLGEAVDLDEVAIKVPQKFVDHARAVGSTVGFAELTYRNWQPRGLTDKQILDKITAHGEKKKNESLDEAVDLDKISKMSNVKELMRGLGGKKSKIGITFASDLSMDQAQDFSKANGFVSFGRAPAMNDNGKSSNGFWFTTQ